MWKEHFTTEDQAVLYSSGSIEGRQVTFQPGLIGSSGRRVYGVEGGVDPGDGAQGAREWRQVCSKAVF